MLDVILPGRVKTVPLSAVFKAIAENFTN